jgi:hypothetical protein
MGNSMSAFVLAGDSSGAITLQASSVAGTNTITLPAETGTVLTKSDVIGVSQTWQNVASSRSSNGTTYTNTTGKPITVAFTPGGAASLNVTYRVDGLVIASVYISSANAIWFPFSFIVPAGSTYSITSDRGTTYWTELR